MNANESHTIQFNVINRYTFNDLSHLSWTWNVTSDCGEDPIASGTFDVNNETLNTGLKLSMKQVANRVKKESKKRDYAVAYFFNLRGCLRESLSWAKKGHLLVSQQFRLEFDGLTAPEKPSSKDNNFPSLQVVDDTSMIRIMRSGEEGPPVAIIDKATGTILAFSTPDGKSILAPPSEVDVAGVVPNFTRAATDNDMGGVELYFGFILPDALLTPLVKAYNLIFGLQCLSYLCQWKCHGLDPAFPPKTTCSKTTVTESANGDRVEIEVETAAQRHGSSHNLFQQTINYTVFDDYRIRVTNHVKPCPSLRVIPSLPRVGMSLGLDSSLFNVTYLGRGPHENYPDRKSGAEMGIWSTTAKENDFEYIFPSENGSKSDCEWVSFRDERGNGVCIVHEQSGMNFNASLYSQTEFHLAKHTCDLPVRENRKFPVHVNIDHKIMGVGGDTR